ncbi:Pyrroline-5-carboxylate reductase [Aquimixticola soesokkakensis]|uniref:Pyrroline-5-carboxylate reductase n=2 Tax=Aquimixticola soesokkakensis TaxID=1519096 RepID=A0A1Y5RR64_9RHOB|nr:Pyrroline-5-carboxylate reductase [Aquimixticola soesokkakensis]
MTDLKTRGLVIVGCGKMGSAMLKGWLANGLAPSSVTVIAPRPSAWLQSVEGLRLNAMPDTPPAMVMLGVKPQIMPDVMPDVARFAGGQTLFLTVAAGLPIAFYEAALGARTPLVRAMPNTPSAIGRGITAIVGNGAADEADLDLCERLLGAVGQVVRLEGESQMNAVAAVSGSGPAYVFHLIETLAAAGEAEGLPADMALKLAKATVGGAGALAEESDMLPSELRVQVTSKGGTTAEALKVLMDAQTGFAPLLKRAVRANINRSEELAK